MKPQSEPVVTPSATVDDLRGKIERILWGVRDGSIMPDRAFELIERARTQSTDSRQSEGGE